MGLQEFKPLHRDFYDRDPVFVSQQILGKYLIRYINKTPIVSKIVETEAYLSANDPAAHSFIGKTARTEILFGEPGFTYVFSLHRYFCLNIVTEGINKPGCVLIRAIEPIEGLELMKHFRNTKNLYNLTSGPGKLCQALNINKSMNGIDVTSKTSLIQITHCGELISKKDICSTPRIGISKAKNELLRFYIKNNSFVSKIKNYSAAKS
jgi:DNA-3-methyladenine glycosylase